MFTYIRSLIVVAIVFGATATIPTAHATPIFYHFIVQSMYDAPDSAIGDGVCSATTVQENPVTGEIVLSPYGCTLRAAIQEANAKPDFNSIYVPAGSYALTIFTGDEDIGENAAASGDLDITSNLSVVGASAKHTIVRIGDNAGQDRVFDVRSGTSTLSHITVRKGYPADDESGAGIRNYGNLTLDTVVVSDNYAIGSSGGGIANIGVMRIIKSTISNNRAFYAAGGISNTGSLIITNSTISGNEAGTSGGGISNSGPLILNNVTITNNTANTDTQNLPDDGGGLENVASGSASLANTIISGNKDLDGAGPDCSGVVKSYGYNLIGSTTGCTITGTTTGNKVGMPAQLGLLQNNGGETPTHALSNTSPALNAGDPATPGTTRLACPTTDQRGVGRAQLGRCDIGAYEFALLQAE